MAATTPEFAASDDPRRCHHGGFSSEGAEVPFAKLREDFWKFWVDTQKGLDKRLQLQERVIVERLERLECLLQCTSSPPTADSRLIGAEEGAHASKSSKYTRRFTTNADYYADRQQNAVDMTHREPPAAKVFHLRSEESYTSALGATVAQQISDEIGRLSDEHEKKVVGFPSQKSARVPTRYARFYEDAKQYCNRRFPPMDNCYCVARCTRSWKFNFVVALLIFLNALTIGVQANFVVGEAFAEAMDRPSRAIALRIPGWINFVFAGCFCAECLWRAYIERSNFIFGSQWRWNVFDLMLVASNVIEVIAETRSLTYARTLRLLRMVHVLQVIRVLRVFDVLRHMVYAILNSMLSLVWIIMVLVLVMYVYGIYILSVVGQHVENLNDQQHPPNDHIQNLDQLFGTLSRSMLSIFEGVTGGRNYSEILDPLLSIHWVNAVMFIVFFIFIVLGVLNIVTGIFVDKATELAKLDKEMTVMNQLDEMNNFVKELKGFFRQADCDSSGAISWEEFRDQLQDSKVKAYFMTIGIDVQSACRVFQMLDRKGNGIVNAQDFVEGCIRLKGAAKSMDVCMLLLDMRRLGNMLEVFMQYTEDELGLLHSMLSNGPSPPVASNSSPIQATSIGERLAELTARHSKRSSFHPLAHAFDYPKAEHATPTPQPTPQPAASVQSRGASAVDGDDGMLYEEALEI